MDAVSWWTLILIFLVMCRMSVTKPEPSKNVVIAAARLGYVAGMTGMTEEELMKELDKAYEDLN